MIKEKYTSKELEIMILDIQTLALNFAQECIDDSNKKVKPHFELFKLKLSKLFEV